MSLKKVTSILFTAAVAFSCGAAQVEAQESRSSAIAPVDPGGSEMVTLQGGDGWKVVHARGWATDDGGRYYDQNLIFITGAAGAKSAPLPAVVRTDVLRLAGTEGGGMLVIDQATLNEIAASLRLGRLTSTLSAVAEPEDAVDPLDDPHRSRCSNTVESREKRFDFGHDVSLESGDLGHGFSGTLDLAGNIHATATAEIRLEILRLSILGICIPYGAQFDHMRAHGELKVGYNSTLSGTVRYANPRPWELEIAKPSLPSLNFYVGPLPVHIGFNLPITVGLELAASVTGSVSYIAEQTAKVPFDYTCTFAGGCSGRIDVTPTPGSSAQPITGSVSGHIEPSVYAQAALRAFLYLEDVAYVQVGVRPYLRGDLWGYHGNNCGDADGDGHLETVDALTLDLDWQLRITAEARLGSSQPKRWDNLWSTAKRHIGFWDLFQGASQAVQPMLAAPNPASVNTAERYDVKMRPCWPYGNTVRYGLSWGDGTSVSLSGAPQRSTSTYKTWPTRGLKPVVLTALSDEHGRKLNATTNRTIQVTGIPAGGVWTSWFDVDDPSGTGDAETLGALRAAGINPCNGAIPIGIECTTLAGVDSHNTGQVYSCIASTGGVCLNALQHNHTCLDYRVRFLCR